MYFHYFNEKFIETGTNKTNRKLINEKLKMAKFKSIIKYFVFTFYLIIFSSNLVFYNVSPSSSSTAPLINSDTFKRSMSWSSVLFL